MELLHYMFMLKNRISIQALILNFIQFSSRYKCRDFTQNHHKLVMIYGLRALGSLCCKFSKRIFILIQYNIYSQVTWLKSINVITVSSASMIIGHDVLFSYAYSSILVSYFEMES